MPPQNRFKLILKHFEQVRNEDFSPFHQVRSFGLQSFRALSNSVKGTERVTQSV